MRRCLGITRNLTRCNRQGEWPLFCPEHRRQPLVWLSFIIFTVIGGIASIYSVFQPTRTDLRQNSIPNPIISQPTASAKVVPIPKSKSHVAADDRKENNSNAENKTTNKARPIIVLCHTGISVTKASETALHFDIPYCSGKNTNAYNVKLEVYTIFKTDNGFNVFPLDEKFPDNITLTYENGRSISYILSPLSYDSINNIYIAIRGTYTNEDGSSTFPIFEIYKYTSFTKSWVCTLGKEDEQVRSFLNDFLKDHDK